MPTYYNNTIWNISDGGVLFPPLENTRTLSYHYNDDLELVSDEPIVTPFAVLYAGTVPSGIITAMEGWNEMLIDNATGADIEVRANEGGDSMIIPDERTWTVKLNREWRAIEIFGDGTGDVRVTVTK